MSSVWEALNDRIMLLVAIFAIISIIPGMIIHPATGWLEGTIILIALFVQVLICAWNDHNKDTKFIELQSMNRDESLPVIRGKHGSMQTVSIWDMVVGDIVSMQPGDKIPADCLVVSSANLRVKEPTLTETDSGVTEISWSEHNKSIYEPFLFADSYLTGGTCKAVVCCVGENSSRGIEDTKYDITQDSTELTRKLDNIGGSLKFIGLISCFIILGVSIAVLFI
jgi:Ca2+-transporting ATPase